MPKPEILTVSFTAVRSMAGFQLAARNASAGPWSRGLAAKAVTPEACHLDKRGRVAPRRFWPDLQHDEIPVELMQDEDGEMLSLTEEYPNNDHFKERDFFWEHEALVMAFVPPPRRGWKESGPITSKNPRALATGDRRDTDEDDVDSPKSQDDELPFWEESDFVEEKPFERELDHDSRLLEAPAPARRHTAPSLSLRERNFPTPTPSTRPGTASAQSSPSFQMSPNRSDRPSKSRVEAEKSSPASESQKGPKWLQVPSFRPAAAAAVAVSGYADRMLVETLCISMRRFRGTSMKAWRCDFDKHGVGWVSRAEFARGCRFYGCPADAIWTSCHNSGGAGMKFWELDTEEALDLELFEQVLWIRTGFDLRQTWAILDPHNQTALTLQEFVRGCRAIGFDGDAHHIFKGHFGCAKALPCCLGWWFQFEGTGTVSKSQFESLLRAALPLDEILYKEEVDHLWAYFPKRDDGDIENSDLVYNQNGDGYVCLHEFIEAHGILQIALRMNPSEDEDPPVLRGDLHNLFVHVIGDSDPRLGLGMLWLLQNVAKQMQRVFKLIAAEKRGDLKESDRLDVFLYDFSYNRMTFSSKVLRRDWEILCIPDLPQGRHQDWLARVCLTTLLSPVDPVDPDPEKREMEQMERMERQRTDLHKYRYVKESFTWTLDDDCQFDQALVLVMLALCTAFGFDQAKRAALNGLSPEVKLFALLKTEGNFGQRLSWSQVQAALSVAVKLGIITQAQVSGCNEKLDDWLKKGMDADGLWCTRETLEVVREKVVTSPSLDHQGLGRVSWHDFEYLQKLCDTSSCAKNFTFEFRLLRSWAVEVCADMMELLKRLSLIDEHAGGWAQCTEPIEVQEFIHRLEALDYPGDPAELAGQVCKAPTLLTRTGTVQRISAEHLCSALFGKQIRRADGPPNGKKDLEKSDKSDKASDRAKKKNPIRKAEWDSSIWSGYRNNMARPSALRTYFSTPAKEPQVKGRITRASSNPVLSKSQPRTKERQSKRSVSPGSEPRRVRPGELNHR
eukprot:s1087_g17.t2